LKTFLMAGCVVLAGAIAGGAQAKVYDCKIKVSHDNGQVPDRVFVEYDASKADALVFDAFINHYFGEAIPAEIAKDNDRAMTFTWDFTNIAAKFGGNVRKVRFRLSIQKANLEANITSTQFFGEPESGFGTCTVK
jgi:hypothetical protein